MPLVIDTYNVLHVTGVLPPELAVGSPEELARLIERTRFARDAVWLVCDGVPRGASRIGRIVIEGAGPGRSADDHIVGFLGRHSASRRFTVVTSDRAILRRARSSGADSMRSDAFLAILADDARRTRATKARPADPRRAVPLSSTEVEGWMRLFEISAEQAAIAAASPPVRPASPAAKPSSPPPSPPPPAATPSRGKGDAELERFLEDARGLDDPLSLLDRAIEDGSVDALLARLGALDDATLEAMMARHEPRPTKGGAGASGSGRRRRGGGR